MEGLLLFVEMENTSYTQLWHGEIDLLVQHWSSYGHLMENVQLEKVHRGLRSSAKHSRFLSC